MNNWSTFRGDLQRRGVQSLDYPVIDEPVMRWSYDTGARVESSPTLWQDRLFVGSFSGYLYALSLEDGTELWRYGTESLVRASPSVVDGVVYFGADDNRLHAVDTQTGERRWAFEFGAGGEQSSPAVVDGTVYFGAFDGFVYALDAATGEKKWSYEAGESMLSSPAVVGDRLFIGVMDGSVHAVHIADGSQAWVFDAGEEPIFGSPAVHDGRLFIGSYDQAVYALNIEDGRQAWRTVLGGSIFSSAAIEGGRVWIGAQDGFYALDPGTGERLWKSSQDTGSVFGSAAVSAITDRIYIGTSESGVLIYQLNGDLVHRLPIEDKVWSSVTVAKDGSLYFGSHDGHIYAFGSAP